jgi:hypothetical protein
MTIQIVTAGRKDVDDFFKRSDVFTAERLSFEYIDERGVRISKSVIGKAAIERLSLFSYAEGIPVAVELNR